MDNIPTVELNPLQTVQGIKKAHKKSKKQRQKEKPYSKGRKKDTLKISTNDEDTEKFELSGKVIVNKSKEDDIVDNIGGRIDIVIQ